MKLLKKLVLLAVIGLMAGCGGVTPQTFYDEHLRCPTVSYGVPAWSVDGMRIYYSQFGGAQEGLHVMSRTGADDYLIDTNVGISLPSPDGTMVLFPSRSTTGTNDLLVLDDGVARPRPLVAGAESPSWSPDSQWVVYTQYTDAPGPLFKLNIQTGDMIQLTGIDQSSGVSDNLPLWSPTGETIAYQSFQNDLSAIYLIDPDGGNLRQLSIPEEAGCKSGQIEGGRWPLAWTPDGQALATAHYCAGIKVADVISLSGAFVADLAAVGPEVHTFEWSPDGTQLAATVLGTTSAVMVADADGANPRVLQINARNPRWSPDGQSIVFEGYDNAGLSQLYTIHPDGSDLRQLTQNPGVGLICPH